MLTADTVAQIAQRLAEHAGLELPAWVVEARAAARIAALGCSADDYVALIDSGRGADELAELIEAVRVGESRLFRHRSQIAVLADVIAPVLRARGRRAIRVWSAGCAAGEEPYTLAIVLSRALPDCPISILATDVSAEALARAAAATYPRAALAHVPARYRDCFTDDGDAIRVVPEITALVELERANLTGGAAPRGCDLVWCRNVLIYFTADARRRAIDRLVGATVPGGFIFVGYSESLRDVPELDGVRAGDTVYYVRRAGDPVPRTRPPTLPVTVVPPGAVPSAVPSAATDRRSAPFSVSEDRTPPTATDRRSASSSLSEARTPPPLTDRRAAPITVRDVAMSPVADRRSAPGSLSDDRTAPSLTDRRSAPISVSDDGTSPGPDRRSAPSLVSEDRAPLPDDTLALHGHPAAARVTAELSARLALPGLRSLTVDVDGADLLGDELAPVLRRARAAARTAGIALVVRATRAGARRWLARHGLDEEAA